MDFEIETSLNAKILLSATIDDALEFIKKTTETADKLGFDRDAALAENINFLNWLSQTYTFKDYIKEDKEDV